LGFTLREIEPSISQVRILSNGREIELNPEVSLNLPTHSNVH
jgi:germination protein M